MKFIISSLLLVLWKAEAFSSSNILSKEYRRSTNVFLYEKQPDDNDVIAASATNTEEEEVEVLDRLQNEWEEEMNAYMKEVSTTTKEDVLNEKALGDKLQKEWEKEMNESEWEEEMNAFMMEASATTKKEVVDEKAFEDKLHKGLDEEMKAFMKKESSTTTIDATVHTYMKDVVKVSNNLQNNWNAVQSRFNEWQKNMNAYLKTLSTVPLTIKNENEVVKNLKDNNLFHLHEKWEKEVANMDKYLKSL